MTTPPLPGIRDAFSSADFLASAEGADQTAPAEGAPAEQPKPDRAEPDSKDKRVRDEYYRNLARSKGEDFARKIGKAEGISHDEMTDILFPKTKGKAKRRGKMEEGETELTPADRRAFAEDANRTATVRLPASEQAAVDAKVLSPEVLDAFAAAEAGHARNAGFARKALQRMATPEEMGDLVTTDGYLSQAGADRLTAALVQRGYDAPDVVKSLYETIDSTSKAIISAMSDTAPLVVRVRQAVAEGRSTIGDPTSDVVEAYRLVERARQTGEPVKALLAQADIERGAVRESVADAVRLFFHEDGLTVAAGREKVAERLQSLFRSALRAGEGPDLFGFEVTPKAAFATAKIAGADIEGIAVAPGRPVGRPGDRPPAAWSATDDRRARRGRGSGRRPVPRVRPSW